MKRYAPNALELASRDVVSRSEQTEIDEGRGINGSVMLDLRHLGAERIIERLPGSRELSMTFAGVDPIYEPIPVRPGAHYHMGGIETDSDGATELTGLYAAGECACVSVHGANRLGGNSLMETITFGTALRHGAPPSGRCRTRRSTCPSRVERDAERRAQGAARPRDGRAAVEDPRRAAASRCSRTSASSAARTRCMRQGEIIQELRERYRDVYVEDKGDVFNSDLTQAIELGNMLDTRRVHGAGRDRAQGEPRRACAAARLSRRATTRTSCKHSISRWVDGGAGAVDCKPVRMTKWEPEERKY